jgi:hypothetical protein
MLDHSKYYIILLQEKYHRNFINFNPIAKKEYSHSRPLISSIIFFTELILKGLKLSF